LLRPELAHCPGRGMTWELPDCAIGPEWPEEGSEFIGFGPDALTKICQAVSNVAVDSPPAQRLP